MTNVVLPQISFHSSNEGLSSNPAPADAPSSPLSLSLSLSLFLSLFLSLPRSLSLALFPSLSLYHNRTNSHTIDAHASPFTHRTTVLHGDRVAVLCVRCRDWCKWLCTYQLQAPGYPPPPPGDHGGFDRFALPGGGEFDPEVGYGGRAH